MKRTMADEIRRGIKSSVHRGGGVVFFAKDLTLEDWKARKAMWPKIDQASKEGKAVGLMSLFGYI